MRHRNRVLERLAPRQGSPAQAIAQRLALEQFHHDERGAVVRAQVEHAADAGMVQGAGGLRLLLEAREPGGIVRQRGGNDLDGDLAAEPGVAGAIHLSHAALPKRSDDLVRTEPGAGGQRHGGTLADDKVADYVWFSGRELALS